MSDLGIYSEKNYRNYLTARLGGKGERTGQKKRAAEALNVNTTFISQVLQGSCDLSLEQAEKMNAYLSHNEEEAEYFILLVLKERAGTVPLKKRFESQLEALKEKRINISNRVTKDKLLSKEDQQRYYSSYIYSAIHVFASIDKYKKTTELCRILGASENEIQSAIEFLKKLEIIITKDGQLAPGSRLMHLEKDSPFIVNHHLNWRLKSVDHIRKDPKKGLHYSGALSLSEEDAFKIKDIIVDALKKSTDIVVKSKEEEAYVLCFDFYNLAY